MARPIKETPILYGEAAKRFEERMKNPSKSNQGGKRTYNESLRNRYENSQSLILMEKLSYKKNHFLPLRNDDEAIDTTTQLLFFDLASVK